MKQGSLQLLTPPGTGPLAVRAPSPIPVPAPALGSILDPDLSREEVLERIDPDTLKTAPLNLLVATAVAMAAPDAGAATEDTVLRYSEALVTDEAGFAYLRLTAEQLVLAHVECQTAIAAYQAAELKAPLQSDWKNPQHFLEACKVHERRMDRLLKLRKEAFDRYSQAAEVYRTAMLTHQGQEILQNVATTRRVPAAALKTSTGVELLPAGEGDGASSSVTTLNVMIVR